MARAGTMASALNDRASPEDREDLEARAVDFLLRAIAGNTARILPRVATDHDLDPLRRRADFRFMMADANFPSDPFTQPPPIAISRMAIMERRAKGMALIAAGRTREAIPYLASASEGAPRDIYLLLQVATLQAWFGQDAEFAVTCRRAIELAKDANVPAAAEVTAKICSLRPSDDKVRVDAALALARRAVELDKNNLPWNRMALGMAEYRSGDDAAAEEALLAAAKAGESNRYITGTSAFYRAMSLFRRGKEVEARRLATEAVSRMRPLPDEDNPLTGGANADDLILWMAFKEAKALLKLEAAPTPRPKPDGR